MPRPFRAGHFLSAPIKLNYQPLVAAVWVGIGTLHRSLRSLCVVLTINQRLRRCAAVSTAVSASAGCGGHSFRGCAAVSS